MEKHEVRITENLWPVLLKETEEGKVEATCPFFSGCQAKGKTPEEAMHKVEREIASKIKNFRPAN